MCTKWEQLFPAPFMTTSHFCGIKFKNGKDENKNFSIHPLMRLLNRDFGARPRDLLRPFGHFFPDRARLLPRDRNGYRGWDPLAGVHGFGGADAVVGLSLEKRSSLLDDLTPTRRVGIRGRRGGSRR